MKFVLVTTTTLYMLKQLVGCDAFQISLQPATPMSLSLKSSIGGRNVHFPLHASSNSDDDDSDDGVKSGSSSSSFEVDVSDLGLTMDDLNAPLPPEMFGMSTSGYESTSIIRDVEDDGCAWTESAGQMEATLTIPGLRGQPAACLAVDYADDGSISVTAFGRIVWSCILRNKYLTDTATFTSEDGPDMVPVIEVSFQKAVGSERWGGFIAQIGENSLL
eukprot:CAMPEP_0197828960 /NCGR_PEP_ID=MMETSP1437-20131217/5445_1 /TAXON_ID=49252 ORGANISM="Eucampia antarctica, Strain CCMP1452" /NCGR_SAMPLE_ID=MMETSP1437 /ASSEMBLY_ACC=CAM_ASM_001096 /LENGTH=217 /DNA_ID=CAMNT_0043430391 /DNA_START=86 /DNA_END=739 /DNA_ORIENTATION=+